MTQDDADFVRELTSIFHATVSDSRGRSMMQVQIDQFCLASAMSYVLQDILDGTEPIARDYYKLDELREIYGPSRAETLGKTGTRR